ncbi:unnamed protein product [Blepharisma stoltei]|uniref:Uncharacterized protein n=1 Tax=Blepharisma stoltei TaxID=1481888 RepID=A0AAU9J3Y9_9CILI|nr:unnamed protein product [Blepharisma stoltei]
MRRMDIEKSRGHRNSDFFEAIDLSQIPTNCFLSSAYDPQSINTSGSHDESSSSEDSKRYEISQPSLDSMVKDCFKRQNCVTEINPMFMVQTEKCNNKLRYELNEILFSGIISSNWEMGEIPDDCIDDL